MVMSPMGFWTKNHYAGEDQQQFTELLWTGYFLIVARQRIGKHVLAAKIICLIPFYMQAVQIHSANGVKLLEEWRGVLSSTPPYK
jgi:hypothetical protein